MRAWRRLGPALPVLLLAVSCVAFTARARWYAYRWPDLGHTFKVDLPATDGHLDNGLRFVVMPDATAGMVQVEVRYLAGASDDPPGKRGLAHLVEHLTYLLHPDGATSPSLAVQFREHTLDHNAYTSWDQTSYEDLVRPDQLDGVLALEASRLAADCTTLDEASFEREREVVRNELRQRGADGDDSLAARLFAWAYPDFSPYALTVGGTDAEVAALTLDDACQFIQANHAPGRAVVVIAGAVDAEHAVAALGAAFSAVPARAAPRAPIARPTLEPRELHETGPVDHPVLAWVWIIPGRFERDGLITELLAEWLDDLLSAALRDQAHVSDVSVTITGGERAPLAVLTVDIDSADHADEVRTDVTRRLARFASTMQRDDLHKAAAELLAQRYRMHTLFGLESLEARTDYMADVVQYADTADPDPAGDPDAAAVRRGVANLATDKSLRLEIDPVHDSHRRKQRAATTFSGEIGDAPDPGDVDPAEAHKLLALPTADQASQAKIRRFTLDNGLRVVLASSPSPLPLVETRLVLDVGIAQEPPHLAGLAALAAESVQYLYVVSDEQMFESRVDLRPRPHLPSPRLGFDDADPVRFDTDVTNDHTTLSARSLNIDLPAVLDDLAFRVANHLDPAPVERVIDRVAKICTATPTGDAVPMLYAFNAAIYGPDHAYARAGGVTLRTALRMEGSDVVDFVESHYVASNATLIVAGNFDPDDIEGGIRELFGRWRAGDPTPAIDAPAAPHVGAIHLGVADTDEDGAQLRIAIGFPAPAGVDGQYAARLVLARMLDLRAGAVRERLGASYGMLTTFDLNVGPSAYLMLGRVDAQRAGESLALLLTAIDDLRHDRGFEADFVRARREVLGELLARSGTASALGAALSFAARYHLADDYRDKLTRLVAKLSPEQVKELIAVELAPEHEVVIVGGTHAQVEKCYADAGLAAPAFMKPWPPPTDTPAPAPAPPAADGGPY